MMVSSPRELRLPTTQKVDIVGQVRKVPMTQLQTMRWSTSLPQLVSRGLHSQVRTNISSIGHSADRDFR